MNILNAWVDFVCFLLIANYETVFFGFEDIWRFDTYVWRFLIFNYLFGDFLWKCHVAFSTKISKYS